MTKPNEGHVLWISIRFHFTPVFLYRTIIVHFLQRFQKIHTQNINHNRNLWLLIHLHEFKKGNRFFRYGDSSIGFQINFKQWCLRYPGTKRVSSVLPLSSSNYYTTWEECGYRMLQCQGFYFYEAPENALWSTSPHFGCFRVATKHRQILRPNLTEQWWCE